MQEKKIAIMTWYQYVNFGTALQASAMHHVISGLGYKPDLVRYQHRRSAGSNDLSGLAKRAVKKLCHPNSATYKSKERDGLFAAYLDQRITLTEECRSYAELRGLNGSYDAFVCGSDQIWSPLGYDANYFLQFVTDTRRMVAYAPSMGPAKTEHPVLREKLARHISRFRHLAVREQQAAEFIRQLTGQDARVVLDPTLLMDAAQWDAYCNVPTQSPLSEPYMVCYFLGEPEKYQNYVNQLSKALNLPFYVIPVKKSQKNGKNALPFSVGPAEFVSLIRHASYVCTDSFHGMAFAVNYGVPFSILKRFSEKDPQNQNSRIINLLGLLQLEHRLADPKQNTNLEKLATCDFTAAHGLLNKYRADSMRYLQQALAQAVEGIGEEAAEPYRITDYCCGCGACAAVCPKEAVRITMDAEGFRQYAIDPELCIRCGKCATVCPMVKVTAPEMTSAVGLYAMQSKKEQILQQSSSGGVGHELAQQLQKEGRYIFGCVYNQETGEAEHRLFASNADLGPLQGSKYIQSRTAETMIQLLTVSKEQPAAFFGTPCQVAAADKLLRSRGLRENVLLVDLICHGVPSDFLWKRYLEEQNLGQSPKVSFRYNANGAHPRRIRLEGRGKVLIRSEGQDDFYAIFRRGLCDMKSCSECPYRQRSAADLRLGDYWGSRYAKEHYGVSMVVANTQVGDDFLKGLDCRGESHPLQEYWTVQHPNNHAMPLEREELISALRQGKEPLHSLRRRYCAGYDLKENLSRVLGKAKAFLKRG